MYSVYKYINMQVNFIGVNMKLYYKIKDGSVTMCESGLKFLDKSHIQQQRKIVKPGVHRLS